MQLAPLVIAISLVASPAFAQVSRPDGTLATPGVDYATAGAAGVPAGLIAFYNGACPTGWTEVTAARGRLIVGTPASGTDAATVGTALTDAQDKSVTPAFSGTPFTAVINHTHPVTDPGHTHLTQRYPTATGGSSGFTIDTSMSGTLADNTLPTKSATTGVTTGNPAGGVASITPAGTVSAVALSSLLATIQFRVCSKD